MSKCDLGAVRDVVWVCVKPPDGTSRHPASHGDEPGPGTLVWKEGGRPLEKHPPAEPGFPNSHSMHICTGHRHTADPSSVSYLYVGPPGWSCPWKSGQQGGAWSSRAGGQ